MLDILQSILVSFCDLTTIALCIICKVPQIWVILKSQSVEGLSASCLVLELLTYAISLCYNVMKGYPLLSYMEDPFLVAQTLFVLLLVYFYLDLLDVKKLGTIGAGAVVFYLLSLGFPHPSILTCLLSATVPMKISSKLMQVREIWKNKSAGNVSLASWIINVYTCATRIVTTVLVTGDGILISKHVISMTLNCLVIATAWHFEKQKKEDKKIK